MKTFQSEIYNQKRQCYETVLVSWLHSPINGEVTIKEIKGRDGALCNEIQPAHLQAIHREAEKLSRHLTHAERVEMMNELYSGS